MKFKVYRNLVATFVLFATVQASAGDLSPTLGIGIFGSAKNSLSETKITALTYTSPLGQTANYYLEGGGWIDKRKDLGRKASSFVGGGYGARVDTLSGLYLGARAGINAISTLDTMLGGHFQFSEELSGGLRGAGGVRMGFAIKHFSSAGLYKINQGRDFATLSIVIPLGGQK